MTLRNKCITCVLYGKDSPLIRGDRSATPIEEVASMNRDRNEMLSILKDRLAQAQNRMKQPSTSIGGK